MKKIILVTGDPNSINTEIISKTWKKLNKNIKRKIFFIGSCKLIKSQLKTLKSNLKVIKVENLENKKNNNSLKVIDIPLSFSNPYKVSSKKTSDYVLKSLDLAHKLVLNNKNILGLINCPINKKLILKTNKVGITEYLAFKNKVKRDSEIMMIYNKRFSVVPLTTHTFVRNVNKKINTNFIKNKVKNLNNYYFKLFHRKPKIGILGMNPHNAELKKTSEEKKFILPAIKKLKKLNVNIKGPLVPDTTFISSYKSYDLIIGMYHDQVLTPFKTLFNFDAINITLGLNYLRVSPDHGPATDIIKKNKANSLSLFNCIKFLNDRRK